MITRRADNQYVVVQMMKEIVCFALQYLAWQHARLQARLKWLQYFAPTAASTAFSRHHLARSSSSSCCVGAATIVPIAIATVVIVVVTVAAFSVTKRAGEIF